MLLALSTNSWGWWECQWWKWYCLSHPTCGLHSKQQGFPENVLIFPLRPEESEQLNDVAPLALSDGKNKIPATKEKPHTVSVCRRQQWTIQCSSWVLLWFIVCIGLHDHIQQCHTDASILQLLSDGFSLWNQTGHWGEAQSESPSKIFESMSS